MAELEKKYADFQESECKEEQQIEVVDPKICPTCIPNPNFKLSDSWWEIEEGYLNEAVCEYHIRIYEGQAKRERENLRSENSLGPETTERDIALSLGITNLLIDLDKPVNNVIRNQLLQAAYIKDNFLGTRSRELGTAYLIAVPAFNFDQIESNDDPDGDAPVDTVAAAGNEIIVDVQGLNRKLIQIKLSMNVFQQYYSILQSTTSKFIIRRVDDPILRINYGNIIKKINVFKNKLSEALLKNGYPRIDRPGLFKSKRAQRIKFTFKENAEPFTLDKVFALPDDGCGKYRKINIPSGNPLRKPSMAVVYSFLTNLDSVINDITAKETMPWTEWTIKHVYPEHVVDYGNIEDIPNMKSGVECLLESQLGIGGGQGVDSLTKEIMSAFTKAEQEMMEQACKNREQRIRASSTTYAEEKKKEPLTAKEEREAQMKQRYENEFKNKFLDYSVATLQSLISGDDPESQSQRNAINRNNVFSNLKKIDGIEFFTFQTPTYKFKNKDLGIKITAGGDFLNIYSMDELKTYAKHYASAKFNNLEDGSVFDQVENSPHFAEAKDASLEFIEKFEDTYIDSTKEVFEGLRDVRLKDYISTIGICGMSKIAGKALECIANGVSFDDFLDILIDKTFDFMEVNTLSLFMNGLPADFREDLNNEIEKQFGPGVNLSALFGVKSAEGGDQKMKDFVKSKETARRALRLLESTNNNSLASISPDDRQFLESKLGEFGRQSYTNIFEAMKKAGWTDAERTYSSEKLTVIIEGKEKTFKRPKKYPIKIIKKEMKEYKKSQGGFKESLSRFGAAVGETWDTLTDEEAKDARRENRQEQREARQDEREARREEKKQRKEDKKELKQQRKNLKDLNNQIKDLEKEISKQRRKSGELQQIINLRAFPEGLTEADVRQSLEQVGQELLSLNNNLSALQSELSENYSDFEPRPGAAAAIEESEFLETDLNQFESAAAAFESTALGVKVDAVFDVIFDFAIDYVIDLLDVDELLNNLRSYPAVDFALDKLEGLLKNCPSTPVIQPPPADFLKSLSIDVCDRTASISMPKVNVPSINFRYQIDRQFNEVFREAIIKLASDTVIRILQRLMSTLESALCNLVEAAGGFVAEGIQEGNLGRSLVGLGNSFVDALNEAFCNDGDDPNTAQSKAEQLADALFSPLVFDPNQNFAGSGAKVSNIVASVSSKDELMAAMVAIPGEEDPQFNKRIANAITALAPEMEALLGSPDQVAYFFSNLGSYLSPEDRKRIRDLLDAGIPNLPVSDAICLTNDQLDNWNQLRKNLLSEYPDPQAIVDDLNNKTLDALEEIMDDIGDLATDGPFLGSMTNEALKDVCNPDNLFNDVSQSEFDKQQEDELIDAFYSNISRALIKGFTGRNSVLGEALADKLGKKEFGRRFFKIFNPNYQNSQIERNNKYNSRSRVGKLLMDVTTQELKEGEFKGSGEAIGAYPETVAISQRKKILDENSKSFDFVKVKQGKKSSKNVVYRYRDELDGSVYRVSIAASNLRRPKKVFGYNLQVIEKIGEEQEYAELSMNVPVSISDDQNEIMKSFGFSYETNESKDIRKSAFNHFMSSKIPLNKNYDKIFINMFKIINTNLVESLLTSAGGSIPNGYQFGYIDEQLTTESFEYYNDKSRTEKYNLDEEDQTLGVFGSDRIVPLDPKLYGGRYSNPPYYIEPRQFTGWLEIAVKAFDSPSGCDPKTPPLISFQDISQRTKNLSSTIKNDPRLSKSPECVSVKPFHILIDSKNKAKMDGVVRTTIRSYVAEYFIKGYGLFSNIDIRNENFDNALFLYIVNKMKSEMFELGTPFANKKIRIARERYWYTFLEQCVEAYQRTIDVDGVEPPDNVMAALMKIQKGLDKFVPIDRRAKKKMKEIVKNRPGIRKPPSDYNPITVAASKPAIFGLQSVAFRLTTDAEEREKFFNGERFDDITAKDIRKSSIKKLRFFQKIYFIKLFESESILIMSELIRDEINRFSNILNDGLNDKPYYRDLYKSFFGMNSFFPDSTSQVGLNSYYVSKQANGEADTGEVPTTKSNNNSSPLLATSEPQLIVESYVRLTDREDQDFQILNRPAKYKDVVSLDDMSDFLDENIGFLQEKSLSDIFGNLSFTYKGSFKSLMEKGFANQESIIKLGQLNKEEDVNSDLLQDSFTSYVAGRSFEDFQVTYDESFLLDGEEVEPSGTSGSTGVAYGIRLCMVMPQGFISESDKSKLISNSDFSNLSQREKSYIFQDGGFVVPLVSQEVDVVDSSFNDFDPFSGIERYDLECLINKLVESNEFLILFDKIFNMRQASSMLATYCIESLIPSIGRDEEERINPDSIDDVEDSWDGTINKFAKNFLRREFKSLYLSNTEDGNSADEDDNEDRGRLFSFGNPFDSFALPAIKIPWWYRRRLKTKIYDANRVECVDPKKDLE